MIKSTYYKDVKVKKLTALLILFCMPNMMFAADNELFYEKLVQNIESTIGSKNFPKVNGIFFNGDCSGFIAYLFHLTGLNLRDLYGTGSNGVTAIWNGLSEMGYTLDHNDLQAGDIIFFDNTYDRNKNGVRDDYLSHIAVIESVDEYGTATYVHYGSKGVVRAKINLNQPEVFETTKNGERYRYNSYLRNAQPYTQTELSGYLYRGAARITVAKS